MAKHKFWIRIGATVTVELPENYTDNQLTKALEKTVMEHNPLTGTFCFDGETYMPEDEDNVRENEISFSI